MMLRTPIGPWFSILLTLALACQRGQVSTNAESAQAHLAPVQIAAEETGTGTSDAGQDPAPAALRYAHRECVECKRKESETCLSKTHPDGRQEALGCGEAGSSRDRRRRR
ncbi:MAG: hypothetical protein AAGF11_39530 [Myxococcota bacterium]